jgi:hypothetical protein
LSLSIISPFSFDKFRNCRTSKQRDFPITTS